MKKLSPIIGKSLWFNSLLLLNVFFLANTGSMIETPSLLMETITEAGCPEAEVLAYETYVRAMEASEEKKEALRCEAEERAFSIGFFPICPQADDLTDQVFCSTQESYTLPAITGSNLSGCEANSSEIRNSEESINIATGELGLNINQSSCVDNTDGTFTATYDIMLNWENPPATGGLTLTLYGDGALNTTTVSAAIIAGGTSTTLIGALTVPADGNGSTGILAAFDDNTTCKDSIGFKAPVPCPNDITPCASTSGCLGGNVFEDFNCNGTDDTEPGVQGVQVDVYDCTNTLVGTSYTDSDGDWQVCSLMDGDAYRVEFVLPEAVACWATPTHVGGDNGSDVQFVTAPACTQFSVSSPNDYCQDTPYLITSCYINGATNTGGLDDVLIRWSYNNSGNGPDDKTVIATKSEIGATWGLAVLKESNSIFSGAFLKRHVGLVDNINLTV